MTEFARVLAVEPDPAMRRWFAALCPRAQLMGGAAEQVSVADASVDGVFVAEAFHWFAHERALAEFARVLRPNGAPVVLWNLPAGPTEPAIPAVEQLLAPYWPKDVELPLDLNPHTWPYAREWPQAFEHSMFEPLRESRFANPQTVDPDGLVAFLGSVSAQRRNDGRDELGCRGADGHDGQTDDRVSVRAVDTAPSTSRWAPATTTTMATSRTSTWRTREC